MAYLPWVIFALAAVLLLYFALPKRSAVRSAQQPVEDRRAARTVTVALPTRPANPPQRMTEKAKTTIRDRLVHAGVYNENVLPLLRVTRFVLLAAIVFVGYQLSVFGLVSLRSGLIIGALGGLLATIAPGFVLDRLKARRQLSMRRAMPDALDVIVVSLEGGLPIAASFQRVSSELAGVHPLLAAELTIMQREVQMGRSLGQAMLSMAARFDLDDLRGMAAVIQQSEKYGASVTRAFRVFANGLRETRQQRAEELARQASVKLLFPTVLFIFPAMFVVILGPTIFRLLEFLRTVSVDPVLP